MHLLKICGLIFLAMTAGCTSSTQTRDWTMGIVESIGATEEKYSVGNGLISIAASNHQLRVPYTVRDNNWTTRVLAGEPKWVPSIFARQVLRVEGLGISADVANQAPYYRDKAVYDMRELVGLANSPGFLTLTCNFCKRRFDYPNERGLPPLPAQNKTILIMVTSDDIAKYKDYAADITKQKKADELVQQKLASEKKANEERELKERALAMKIEKERIGREGDGSPDDLTCKKYGFKPNTDGYAQCRLQIDLVRNDALQKQAAYDEQLRQYEAQVAAANRERERRKNEALTEFGLRMMSGQSPISAAASVGTGAPMGPPPIPTSSRTYTLPGNKIMTCTTTGSMTNCY